MSKKRKSSKKNSLNFFYCGALLFSLVSISMLFVNNLSIVGNITEVVHYSNTGWQAVFGFMDENLEVYSFSIINLITYLLVCFGFVIILLKVLKLIKSKICDFIAICLFLIGGIFFFLIPTFAVSPYASSLGSLVVIKLGVGAIVGGIFAILSACILFSKAILKK